MKRYSFLFGLIIILAIVLRFYQLGKTPISLEWDEVALGYDAYSILKTGRDQFGKFLPLTFRSLDDYKPPIYEYITVPSIAVFGLNEFSTRFPSAFFGILTVIMTFYLSLTIFSGLKFEKSMNTALALLASFLLAVSPWHLQFSRAAFEVNISVFITVTAVTLFLRGLKNHKIFLISAIFFGLDLFSYHSARVVGPLLLAGLFIIFNKQLPEKKHIVRFLAIFFLFVIAFIPTLISSEAQIRFKATNIFNPGARYLEEKDLNKIFLERRIMDKKIGFELAGRIFHNQRLIFLDFDTLQKSLGNYLSNFGLEYLFIKGDAPLHHAPGFGLLYVVEFPFLIVGIIYLLKYGISRYSLVIFLWLLLAPLPNAVTREAPHSVRTELILPMYQLLTALGIIAVLKLLRNESGWIILIFIIGVAVIFSINHSFYLHQYYIHTNIELSSNWMYGRKEAVAFTEIIKKDYNKVLVSLRVDMPYIFWLFYTKYPPEKYLKEGGTASGGFEERNQFDKYEFRFFDYYSELPNNKVVMVGVPAVIKNDFPPDAKVLKQINYLDDSEAIKIVENRGN